MLGKEKDMIFNLKEQIKDFVKDVGKGEIEIYNEFSLQHELGIFLKKKIAGNNKNIKVQFERNVEYFFKEEKEFVKKEIDISVFEKNEISETKIAAIELKFPRNGQYPEQMFSFCKDIKFAEELTKAGFKEAFVVIFVDDHLFYEDKKENKEPIYQYFRGKDENGLIKAYKPLSGEIQKPTGNKKEKVVLSGSYKIEWHPVVNSENIEKVSKELNINKEKLEEFKYTLIEVSKKDE